MARGVMVGDVVVGLEPIEPACDCWNKQTRLRTLSNGATQYVPQCLHCGRAYPAVKKDSLTPRQREQVEPFDPSLCDAWQERCDQYFKQRRELSQQKRDAEYAAIQPERRREYLAYLQTPEWQEKRAKVFRRAQGLCEGCLDAPATQVHHLTYLHIFYEFLFELVALCRRCHQRLHGDEIRLAWGDD